MAYAHDREMAFLWADLNSQESYICAGVNMWKEIPDEIKREATQRMKICTFWLPILLQRDPLDTIVDWAVNLQLINSKDCGEITLKNLDRIQSVESVMQAVEKAYLTNQSVLNVVKITHLLSWQPTPPVLNHVLCFLEENGDFGVRHRLVGFSSEQVHSLLVKILMEFFKFVNKISDSVEETMKQLKHQPPESLREKSDEMKRKGNESFKKMQYEEAVKFYTKALSYYPDNHIIYGNRALCYIKSQNFLKAVIDGKCAVLINPLWPKGHYRFCEALFHLGELSEAIKANHVAILMCQSSEEGTKDLEEQSVKFVSQYSLPPRNSCGVGKNMPPRGGAATNPPNKARVSKNSNSHKVSEGKPVSQTAKTQKTAPPQESNTKDVRPTKSDVPSKNIKPESNSPAKKKKNNKTDPAEKTEKADNKNEVCKKLQSAVKDGCAALVDLRSRNAEQAFGQALTLLETVTTKNLSPVDPLLLLFGRALALTEIGHPEELLEAQKLLEKIKSYEERTFQCLTYYAIGRVYLRQNRFAVALEHFLKSQQMVKNRIIPGKLTWPLTKEVVKETELEFFKDALSSAIQLCRFPPAPDAICRYEMCVSPVKIQIYFTDPDFKGFIRICCSEHCTIEYHPSCWKTLKPSFNFESEKDFLLRPCLTPACVGQICRIRIFDQTGLVKYELDSEVPKKKPKVNQKCPSLKMLTSKEERKKKRKLKRQCNKENASTGEEILPQSNDRAAQSQQKAWLLYRDRVLLQISQNMELLKKETALKVSVLTRSLKPWLELDSRRGHRIAEQMLNWREEEMPSLGETVEILLERKNKVWARVFIQELSVCGGLNPSLSSWACRLNDAGLAAATSFIDTHSEHLEQLDLALLFDFAPLHDAIIEKLGARPEIFSSIGLTLTEFLKQAQPEDVRIFIWTLEEHRNVYVSCHTILDEYFDIMDGHCSIIKKSGESENITSMKGKSRGRKKKQKESKSVIMLSGVGAVSSRQDWNQEAYEDESLSFLHPVDPFSVPSHLQEQVADFEDQYNSTRGRGDLMQILGNNPDPTKESLYDYFAQILDKHGPRKVTDPLLVGEVENFPVEAKQKIEECGGFEFFLLNSPRFIKMGPDIGLAPHAVSLQQAQHTASLNDLNDLEEISEPDFYPEVPDFYSFSDVWVTPVSYYAPYQPDLCAMLPNPYINPPQMLEPLPMSFLPEVCGNSVYDWEVQEPGTDFSNSSPAAGGDETLLTQEAGVQTVELMRSVAVNTEIYEPYEKVQGDINRSEKTVRKLEQDINNIKLHSDTNRHSEINALEDELQKITANIQVTNKELMLFQQKLEEEVKRDQKEKKENQEALKSLKKEIEELVGGQERLKRNIRETKSNYEAKLTDFLELSNQLAAEKMSLEDEIKRCQTLLISSNRRSDKAQVLVVESSRDEDLYILHRDQANTKALLTKLNKVSHKVPNEDLAMLNSTLMEIEKKISSAEQRFKMQMDQMRSGSRLKEEPEAAAAAAVAPFSAAAVGDLQPAAQASHSTHPPAAAFNSAPQGTVFNRALQSLNTLFPHYSRPELTRFIQELRSSSGGSFSGMTLPEVVSGVTQLILDHQERTNTPTPPLTTPVWQTVGRQPTSTNTSALNVEDPCIICHEDMTSDDTCVLDCRHSFHNECIRSWLREQTTCPTCRTLALLPEDFPALAGKRRPAQ